MQNDVDDLINTPQDFLTVHFRFLLIWFPLSHIFTPLFCDPTMDICIPLVICVYLILSLSVLDDSSLLPYDISFL